tara:strand:- start:61094 stop:62290 length:1197 start_codon:yes stop_codon:yes gene_type:complete
MRLVLLFSTFPVRTETFLQREVEALLKADREIELWSFWGGEVEFRGRPVQRFRLVELWLLLLMLPYWFLRSPRRFFRVFRNLVRLRWRNPTNFFENLLGFGYGIILARKFEREATDDTVLHAVWASLPATIGWTVHLLTGLRFSFAGHAYDLFEDGGDALIRQKMEAACALRTSTEAGAARFLELGADQSRLRVIRRGFAQMPSYEPKATLSTPLRLAVVGRFVPKMGYDLLGDILDHIAAKGVLFQLCIIGDGPGRRAFEMRMDRSVWADRVELRGAQPFEEVLRLLSASDALLFTGTLAKSGDQAGFPNVIAEAMALGCSVIASPVGGVTEVVQHRVNGFVAGAPEAYFEAIIELQASDEKRFAQLAKARKWVEENFNAHANMAEFCDFIEESMAE